MCIVVVVVTHESYIASYFPEAGHLNGKNADMCSNMAGPLHSGSGDLFELKYYEVVIRLALTF